MGKKTIICLHNSFLENLNTNQAADTLEKVKFEIKSGDQAVFC